MVEMVELVDMVEMFDLLEMVEMVELVEMIEMIGGLKWLKWLIKHKVGRKVLDKSFQAPILAEVNYHRWVGGGGWLAGSNETKANSAQFGLKQNCLKG